MQSSSNLSPTAAAAAAADFAAAASIARSRSLGVDFASPGTSNLSPTEEAGSVAPMLDSNLSTAASAPARDSFCRTSSNLAASFARMRSSSGMFGGSVVTDPDALAQLTAVRASQAKAYRWDDATGNPVPLLSAL